MTRHEEWRPIVNFEGLYEVSNQGRVRSLPRKARDGRVFLGRDKVLTKDADGRVRVSLSRDGKPYSMRVHRLVALAFLGEPEPGQEVCHNDGVASNNRVENLRWDTRKSNLKDSLKHGAWRNQNVDKEICVRGHPLEGNNRRNQEETHRSCKACNRARSYVRFHPHLAPHLQQLSDWYLSFIVSGEPTPQPPVDHFVRSLK